MRSKGPPGLELQEMCQQALAGLAQGGDTVWKGGLLQLPIQGVRDVWICSSHCAGGEVLEAAQQLDAAGVEAAGVDLVEHRHLSEDLGAASDGSEAVSGHCTQGQGRGGASACRLQLSDPQHKAL